MPPITKHENLHSFDQNDKKFLRAPKIMKKVAYGLDLEDVTKILVILNPTGYMLTSSSGFASFISFEVYSIDSSKTTSNSPEVSNFNRLFFLQTQMVHL